VTEAKLFEDISHIYRVPSVFPPESQLVTTEPDPTETNDAPTTGTAALVQVVAIFDSELSPLALKATTAL
jgi:hypothetical protein